MTRSRLDRRAHGQPAALRHRVLGVEEQVEEHLLQLVLDARAPSPARSLSSRRTLMRWVANWCSSSPSTSAMHHVEVDDARARTTRSTPAATG